MGDQADEVTHVGTLGIFDDPDCYPGVVLRQPFAGAVMLAAQGYRGKTIETRRTRILRVPTPLVVIAGHRRQVDALVPVHDALVNRAGVPVAAFDRACSLVGVAVALVTVVACRRLTASDVDASLWWDAAANAAEPRWAWVLADMRALRPFQCRGIPGFVRVSRVAVTAALG